MVFNETCPVQLADLVSLQDELFIKYRSISCLQYIPVLSVIRQPENEVWRNVVKMNKL